MKNYYYFYSFYNQKHIETWFMTEKEAKKYASKQGFVYEKANS